MGKKMILLLSFILLGLAQFLIHRLSHALTIIIGWNWRPTLFPIIYYKGDDPRHINAGGWALITIMPRIVNIVFIFVSLIFVRHSSIAVPLAIVNFIDYIYDVILYIFTNKTTDFRRFNIWLNISSKVRYLYLLIGIYLVIVIWFII